MARWTVAEAIAALETRDKDAREDIGRTCPLFVTATPEEILKAVDLMTARQVEARLRQMLDDAAEEEEQPKKRKKKVKPVEKNYDDEEDEEPVVPDFDEDDDSPTLTKEEEDALDDIFDDL